MFIIGGTRLERDEGGVVGHFCAVCRTIRLFKVIDIWRVQHLYYVGLGSGEHEVTELVCAQCGMVIGLKQHSGEVAPSPDADLTEFASRTSPLGREHLLARVDLEKRAIGGKVTCAERQQLIAEPFLALEYLAQVEQARGADRPADAVIGLTIVVTLASIIMWGLDANRFWTIVVTLASAAMLFSLLSRAIHGHGRLKSRKLLEQLGKALRPLHPSPAEVENTLASFRKRQTVLGLGLTATSINSAIKEGRASRS